MSKPSCSVPDCERVTHCRGYCQRHYVRFLKHGDPGVDLHRLQVTVDGLRICKGCQEPKHPGEFHKDGGSPDGLRAQCKRCRSTHMAAYQKANSAARKAYADGRRVSHADHIRALDTARYERDKDKRIALASDNVRLRRARLAGIESDPSLSVAKLREIHGDGCCYCSVTLDFIRGKRGDGIAANRATLEHILPVTRGGTHTFDNAALACHRCNVRKNNKTLEEWNAWKESTSGREKAVAAGGS